CSEDGTTRIECFENLLGILVVREIDDNELQKFASTAFNGFRTRSDPVRAFGMEPGAAPLCEVLVRLDDAGPAMFELLIIDRCGCPHHFVERRAVAVGRPNLEAIFLVAAERFGV